MTCNVIENNPEITQWWIHTVAELKYHTILISNSDLADLSKIYWVLENVLYLI